MKIHTHRSSPQELQTEDHCAQQKERQSLKKLADISICHQHPLTQYQDEFLFLVQPEIYCFYVKMF